MKCALHKVHIIEHSKSSVELTPHLRTSEVKCKCQYDHCVHSVIAESVVESFEKTRVEYSSAITVSSGYRCNMHNRDVGGLRHSRHTKGFALDLVAEDLERLYQIATLYFDVVLMYDGYIHCHNRLEK